MKMVGPRRTMSRHRFHKTSHGMHKAHVYGYTIQVVPKTYDPTLDDYGLPRGFPEKFESEEEARKAVKKLRSTKKYSSIRLVRLKGRK